jgi:RNA polymerase sigma factor (sigma-70 family)
LNAEERQTVELRVLQKHRYVDHPAFKLFGENGDPWHDSGQGSRSDEPIGSSAALGGRMMPFSHLLTSDEETDLFMRMNYARLRLSQEAEEARKRRVPISRAKEILEWDRVEREARARLVASNMPLVLSMAKKVRILGVDFGDIVCEGNMALLRAVDGFDCSRGFKFSTYACRAILKSFARLATKNNRYRSRFPTEFDPTYERSDWAEVRRREAAEFCTEQLVSILRTNAAELTATELAVIEGRFAFGKDQVRKTLVQMGESLGLTKERVRQIQKKAVRKLREALEDRITGT